MDDDFETKISDFCVEYEEKVEERKSIKKNNIIINISSLDPELKSELIEKYYDSSVRKAIQDKIDSMFLFKSYIMYDGLDKITEIRDLSSELIGNLLRIGGVVISVSQPQSIITNAKYFCSTCKEEGTRKQQTNIIDLPQKCEEKNCSGRIHLKPEESEWDDYQIIKIQERPDAMTVGDVPRVLKVRIIGRYLIDKCQPGDSMWVNGIMNVEQRKPRDKVFRWYLEANNIEVDSMDIFNTELTVDETRELDNWARHPEIEKIIINSLFPSIYGLEDEKFGLALALFGGKESERRDIVLRGSINVLLIGDPSTAKTAMITAATRIAPKAIYTQAGSTSGVGLTAAAIKEEEQNVWKNRQLVFIRQVYMLLW
jgi:replicative DNA helicase Mcm